MKLKSKKNENKSPNTEYPAGSRCDGLPRDAEQSECLVLLLLSLPPPGFHSTRDGSLIYKKNLHHRSSFFIFQSRKSNFNLEPQCRFRFLAPGQGFKDDEIKRVPF